jgi:hypothetical protein
MTKLIGGTKPGQEERPLLTKIGAVLALLAVPPVSTLALAPVPTG